MFSSSLKEIPELHPMKASITIDPPPPPPPPHFVHITSLGIYAGICIIQRLQLLYPFQYGMFLVNRFNWFFKKICFLTKNSYTTDTTHIKKSTMIHHLGPCDKHNCVLTLKEYSSLTRKGKEMAWRILFSFNVCSTCFNLTTYPVTRQRRKRKTCNYW